MARPNSETECSALYNFQSKWFIFDFGVDSGMGGGLLSGVE